MVTPPSGPGHVGAVRLLTSGPDPVDLRSAAAASTVPLLLIASVGAGEVPQ